MPATDQTTLETCVFQLGHSVFTIQSSDESRISDLKKLFLLGQSLTDGDEVLPLPDDCANDVRKILEKVKAQHKSELWMDAALLIAPSGKTVLLIGHSRAGKTTLSLALVAGSAWKIVAEGTVFVELKSNRVLSFPAPFCMRWKTRINVFRATGAKIEIIRLGREYWAPSKIYATLSDAPARFDLAVVLEGNTPVTETPLAHEGISSIECLKKVLSRSNLITVNGGIDKMTEYLMYSSCHSIQGGSVLKRLQLLNSLAQ
jgi:hypothetical protein